MLRKFILLCFILGAFNLKAQFTINKDTVHISGFAKVQQGDFVDHFEEAEIKSSNAFGEMIKWNRLTNDLPDQGWSTAICDIISCKPPEVDTGSFFLNGMDSGKLSLHCYPSMVRGNGKMVVRFSRVSNPMDYVDVVVLMEIWKPNSVLPVTISKTTVYPNPSSGSLVAINDEIQNGELQVLNSLGQVVLTAVYQAGQPVDVSALAQGVYTLVISDGTKKSVQPFAKN